MVPRADWREVLDQAERRDPVGHAVHLLGALAFIVLMPLGTAPSNIVSLPLLVIALLRVRSCGDIYRRVLQWPPAWTAIAFVAWSAISVTWSSDPELAGRWLSSMRLLILPLLLAPLLARVHLLAGALLGSISLQALVQCGEYLVNRTAWNFDGLARFGGFTGDPGKAGLWAAIGVCGSVTAALLLRGRASVVFAMVSLLCLGGVAASGTRRQFLALAVALPALLVFVIACVPGRRRRAIVMTLTLGAALGISWPVIGPSIMTRVRQTSEQIAPDRTAAPMRGIVHYDLRGYYWRASFEAWRSVPWRGLGLGGTAAATTGASNRPAVESWLREEMFREYPDWSREAIEQELERRLGSRHPHSTWVQLLVETGIIGLGLALATWCLAWAATIANAWHACGPSPARIRMSPGSAPARGSVDPAMLPLDPAPLACAAGLLLWAVGAIFDASISSTSLGAAAVLAALGGLAPIPPRRYR